MTTTTATTTDPEIGITDDEIGDMVKNAIDMDFFDPADVKPPEARKPVGSEEPKPAEPGKKDEEKKDVPVELPDDKPVSKYKAEDKENVIISIATEKEFCKVYELARLLKIEFKTLNDLKQKELNYKLQVIDTTGDRRKNAFYQPSGTGQEVEVYYHTDSRRATRMCMLAYHLKSISGVEVSTPEEAYKLIYKYPTQLLDIFYARYLVNFLNMVTEALEELPVF